MNERERIWKLKRCGVPTSSALEKLDSGGRENLKGDELIAAKIAKSRTTVDVEFGEVAKGYIRELIREKKRNKPTFHRDNFNFDWGHKQEPMAIAWLRQNTMLDVKSCTEDFSEIVFNICECGLGDSPDFYVGEDVGEIKCPTSEAKFEAMLEMDKWEIAEEYSPLQLAGHFIGKPDAKKLYLLVYDGQNDDDEMDILDPLAPERGILVEFTREEFEDKILKIEEKVRFVVDFMEKCLRGEAKVNEINKYWNKKENLILCSQAKKLTP